MQWRMRTKKKEAEENEAEKKEEQNEDEHVEEPQHRKQKCKYIQKEPTPPPKLVPDKKTAAKKVKKRASQKRFKALKCPRMEKVVTLSLNCQTTNRGKKLAVDWLREVATLKRK
jgi:hypothetical protein